MKYDVEIPSEPLPPPQIGKGGYQGFNPRTEILQKETAPFNSRTLPCDILAEHDVSITMRDGIKLYADIYRPPNTTDPVPAILCWSPFGKKFNGIDSLKLITPWNLGIPLSSLSGLEKFEGLDPAEWVDRGYAIVNIDSRGAFDSEGEMVIMGTQEAEDGYDAIEDIALRPWCNGNIGMAGNSHLAIVQWFIASLQPPSLKAIAPWEGCGDLYREQFGRGGIYGGNLFDQLIVKYMLKGYNGMESFRLMFERHPLLNEWWADKRPDMSRINIPTYITGTWTNSMHGMGAIRGWMELGTDESLKWLRFHPFQEWYDLWGNQQAQDELLSFFNRYLKGEENGWESTPHVRMAILRYENKQPLNNVVVENFPIPRTVYRKAYLDRGGRLSLDQPPTGPGSGSVSYTSDNGVGFASFTYTFPQTTQLVGIPKAVLYMSCPATDDMDIYLVLCKLSATGKEQMNLNIPWEGIPVSSVEEIPEGKRREIILYKGPSGILRASHREIDQSKSMHENWPFHPHAKEEKVPAGTVVRLEIGIWAMGVEYEAGESIQLQISGHYRGMNDFKATTWGVNTGEHVVHFGGEYDSHLLLPFCPEL